MTFSRVNSALYTSTFAWANVFAQRVYLTMARATNPERMFETYFGAKMTGDVRDFVQTRIFCFGTWEPNLSRFIENKIKPDTWSIDIGAHDGYFTLLISELAPQGHVTAIEASPTTYRRLISHLAINGRQNITTINKAVAAERGELKLFHHQGQKNTGADTLIAPNVPTPYSVVQADTLMNMIGDNAKRVSFIKMDIEGAERPVLEEILANLDAFADDLTVVAEVNDCNLYLVDRFLSTGFRCSELPNLYGLDAYLSKQIGYPEVWTGSRRHPTADLIFERG
jgi:FkbM family methyltransferase